MELGILEMESNPEVQKAYEYFSVLKTPETPSVSIKSDPFLSVRTLTAWRTLFRLSIWSI